MDVVLCISKNCKRKIYKTAKKYKQKYILRYQGFWNHGQLDCWEIKCFPNHHLCIETNIEWTIWINLVRNGYNSQDENLYIFSANLELDNI